MMYKLFCSKISVASFIITDVIISLRILTMILIEYCYLSWPSFWLPASAVMQQTLFPHKFRQIATGRLEDSSVPLDCRSRQLRSICTSSFIRNSSAPSSVIWTPWCSWSGRIWNGPVLQISNRPVYSNQSGWCGSFSAAGASLYSRFRW